MNAASEIRPRRTPPGDARPTLAAVVWRVLIDRATAPAV